MKRCVIFGAGVYDSTGPDIHINDIIIAADGGYDMCRKLGITPQLTVGDFDSASLKPEGSIIKLPTEKDITDLYAAVEEGLKAGCDEFHIYGGMGGRPDHSFANYSLIADLCEKGIKAYLYGENYSVTALHNGKIRIHGIKGKTLSVFSWSGKSVGVSLKGLKYPLSDAQLTKNFALGVSNSFIDDCAEISVEKGTLIIMYERQS